MSTTKKPFIFDIFDLTNPEKDGSIGNEDASNVNQFNETAAILYTVINCLILLSNLWIILIIVCSKLRRHFYFLNIVVCSVGDLLFVIGFSFEIMTFVNTNRTWKYGRLLCFVTKYLTETHVFFTSLALCSLCTDRILKTTFKPSNFTNVFHVILLALPFCGSFLVLVPFLHKTEVVMLTKLTIQNKQTLTFCESSFKYAKNKILFDVMEIVENTIFLPVAAILMIIIICIYKRRQSYTEEGKTEESTSSLDINISDDADNHDVSILSSAKSVIIVCIVTVACTFPSCIAYFCAARCLPSQTGTRWNVEMVLYVILLIPSVMRPYIFLMDKRLRSALKSGCFGCARK